MLVSLIAAAPHIIDRLVSASSLVQGGAAVVGLILAALTYRYLTRSRPRIRISVAHDPHGNVRAQISNTGKDAIQIDSVELVARGSWAARLLRRLLLRSSFEPVLATAATSDAQLIAIGASSTWRVTLPHLTNWRLPPSLLHPLSTARRGTVRRRRLVLRVSLGQNRRAQYRWYSCVLRIRTMKPVRNTLAA
jgi:hypothetical protein